MPDCDGETRRTQAGNVTAPTMPIISSVTLSPNDAATRAIAVATTAQSPPCVALPMHSRRTVPDRGLASIGGYDDVACTGAQGTKGNNATEWNGLNYLQALYADGIHGYFDAVGWHAYTFWNGETASQMLSYNLCSGWSQMALTPVSVRSLMTAYGDADKQVWITETGAPSCISGATYECVSPTQEASVAEQEAQTWSGLEWAGGFYWYDIRDDQDGTQNMESHFGAVSYPDSPKPVYQALKEAWN